MFFPERIVSIKPSDRVLEIGPGANPHPRADHFLEMRWADAAELYEQSGFAEQPALQRPVTYYDGGVFPFEDRAFDYVICSHVAEHVPVEALPQFMSELERVAGRGYIEVPLVFYEMFNWQPVHKSLISFREGRMLMAPKSCVTDSNLWRIYRALMYGSDTYWYKIYRRKAFFFFHGFEWEKTVPYALVNSLDELLTEQDVTYWTEKFSQPFVEKNTKRSLGQRIADGAKRLVRRFG